MGEGSGLSQEEFRNTAEKVQKLIGAAIPVDCRRLHIWHGWGASPSLILHVVEDVMSNRTERSPPTTLKYFDKPISRELKLEKEAQSHESTRRSPTGHPNANPPLAGSSTVHSGRNKRSRFDDVVEGTAAASAEYFGLRQD